MAEENKPDNSVPVEGEIVVDLITTIPVFNERIKQLKFRRPTAGDIIRIGNPVEFDPISDPPRISHNTQRMTVMMARLSNIPASSFDFLDPQDWVSCAWVLTPFFMPTPGKI